MKRFIATLMAITMVIGSLVSVPAFAVEADASESEVTVIEDGELSIARAGYTQFVTFEAGQLTTAKEYKFKVTKPCVLKLSLYVRGTDVDMIFSTPSRSYFQRFPVGTSYSGVDLLGGQKAAVGTYTIRLSAGNEASVYVATGGVYTTDY